MFMFLSKVSQGNFQKTLIYLKKLEIYTNETSEFAQLANQYFPNLKIEEMRLILLYDNTESSFLMKALELGISKTDLDKTKKFNFHTEKYNENEFVIMDKIKENIDFKKQINEKIEEFEKKDIETYKKFKNEIKKIYCKPRLESLTVGENSILYFVKIVISDGIFRKVGKIMMEGQFKSIEKNLIVNFLNGIFREELKKDDLVQVFFTS